MSQAIENLQICLLDIYKNGRYASPKIAEEIGKNLSLYIFLSISYKRV